MENKDEILKHLALITDGLDVLKPLTRKITLTLYLDEDKYNRIFHLFSIKKDNDDYKFTIYIDSYEIIILKVV